MLTNIDQNRSGMGNIVQRQLLWRTMMLCTLACCFLYAKTSTAGVLDIHFDQEQRYTMKETLAVGKSLELCGLLAQKKQINWRFESDQKLDFNIHYHVGEAVHFPAKLKQSKTSTGQLNVEQEQTYCWMWTNRSKKSASVFANLEQLK